MAGPPSLLKAHPVWPGYLLQPRRGNIRNGPALAAGPAISGNGPMLKG